LKITSSLTLKLNTMIDFMQNLQTEEHSFQEAFENARHPVARSRSGNIPSSKDISGIEVRLSNVVIADNKTPKVFPFPGFARVYFVNLVVTDLSAEALSLDLNGFEKVDDGDKLSLDRTLFAWKKTDKNALAPSQIHVFSSLIKSKQPLRDVADPGERGEPEPQVEILTVGESGVITAQPAQQPGADHRRGMAQERALADLARLLAEERMARERALELLDDLGFGLLVDLAHEIISGRVFEEGEI